MTSRSQTERSTKLNYIPKAIVNVSCALETRIMSLFSILINIQSYNYFAVRDTNTHRKTAGLLESTLTTTHDALFSAKDSSGNRTHISALKGPRTNRLFYGAKCKYRRI